MRIPLLFILILPLSGCMKESADISGMAAPATGQGGSLARFTIVGDYLYTVDRQSLGVFDIGNPASPVFRKKVPVGFDIETIFPFAGKLFIGSATAVHIISLEDPANPVKLSEAISPTIMRRCDPVVAKDQVAYATLRTNARCGGTQSVLAVYDISNITQPVSVREIPVQEPYGLGYSENILYVCDRQQGLLVYDISQPFSPAFIKSVPGFGALDVIPYGNMLICMTETGMTLFDISIRQDPQFLIIID